MVSNDPKGNQVRALKRAPRQVAVATDLRNASISGGRTRFIGDGSLLVEGLNALRVTGSALVSGLLMVVGNLIISGYHGITGTFNSSGPWNFSGTGGITGNVSSTGDWTQTGTYTVNAEGKIIITGTDPMTLGQTSAGRPGIQFSTGAQVVGTSNGAQLNNAAGNGFVFAGDTVGMSRGSKSINVTSTGINADAPFSISGLPQAPTGTTVYMVVADAAGNLYRKSVAA